MEYTPFKKLTPAEQEKAVAQYRRYFSDFDEMLGVIVSSAIMPSICDDNGKIDAYKQQKSMERAARLTELIADAFEAENINPVDGIIVLGTMLRTAMGLVERMSERVLADMKVGKVDSQANPAADLNASQTAKDFFQQLGITFDAPEAAEKSGDH